MGGGRRRETAPRDVREAHAPAFEELSAFEHPRRPAPAFPSAPFVLEETRAVERLEFRDDAPLQVEEISLDGGRIHQRRLKARWPMSVRNCMPSKLIFSAIS